MKFTHRSAGLGLACFLLVACAGATAPNEKTGGHSGAAGADNPGEASGGTGPDAPPGGTTPTGSGGKGTGGTGDITGPGIGTLPELPRDAKNPIGGPLVVQRVLGSELVQHIEHLSWRPPNQLYFTWYPGNPILKQPGEEAIHPFRTWRLIEGDTISSAGELFRFPTSSSVEEDSWCKWSVTRMEFWCFNHEQKTNKFVIRIKGHADDKGALDVKTLDGVTKWATSYRDPNTNMARSTLHDRLLDWAELPDGTIYWTHKRGLGTQLSNVTVSAPGVLEVPVLTDVLNGTTEGPTPDPYGLAASPGGDTLYFTLSGMYAADRKGSLWAASIKPDRTLGAAKKLVDGIPTPRRIACDEFGNIYVASGLEVRVYAPNGATFGSIPIVTEPDHIAKLDLKQFMLLDVEIGGPTGDILYASLGAQHPFFHMEANIADNPIKRGGLYRVRIRARGVLPVNR